LGRKTKKMYVPRVLPIGGRGVRIKGVSRREMENLEVESANKQRKRKERRRGERNSFWLKEGMTGNATEGRRTTAKKRVREP